MKYYLPTVFAPPQQNRSTSSSYAVFSAADTGTPQSWSLFRQPEALHSPTLSVHSKLLEVHQFSGWKFRCKAHREVFNVNSPKTLVPGLLLESLLHPTHLLQFLTCFPFKHPHLNLHSWSHAQVSVCHIWAARSQASLAYLLQHDANSAWRKHMSSRLPAQPRYLL